jgi:predicted HTH transcriptional regulator
MKKAKKATKGKVVKRAAKKPAPAEAGSKRDAVIKLISKKGGATTAEIATITGWQFHTIRGFISGTVQKKLGHKVNSERNKAGDRVYEILQ